MGDLTLNFSKHEFDCLHGSIGNKKEILCLAQQLEVLREEIGRKPINILEGGGYRCEACRKLVGSKPTSQHCKSKAADIWVKDISPDNLAKIIYQLIKAGKMKQGGVGVYFKGKGTKKIPFVHYDTRGIGYRWRQKRK